MTNEEFQALILSELKSIRQDMATQQDVKDVNQSLARIENEQGEKISALFDAREVGLDHQERISQSLIRIESKLDKLSLKVAYHDTTIKKAN